MLPTILVLAGTPWVEARTPRALVIRDAASEGTFGCEAVEKELDTWDVRHDVIKSDELPDIDLLRYTMVILPECQTDGTYQNWNDRGQELEWFVEAGGFLLVHASCWSAFRAIRLPGGDARHVLESAPKGNNLRPSHPLMLGVGSPVLEPMNGGDLSVLSFPSTGNPSDEILVTAVGTGDPVYFTRDFGLGAVVVGGLRWDCHQRDCGTCAFGTGSNDLGRIMANEIRWGMTFPQCFGPGDADGDRVLDDCDRCPTGDDLDDRDEDFSPDACDPCPDSNPDDSDSDGICDDVDDSDGDGVLHGDDNCPNTNNPAQEDHDGDGIGSHCDSCPRDFNAEQLDGDGDGVGNPCDICHHGDDLADRDGDLLPDECDNCPDVASDNQVDKDADGWGELCDCADQTDDVSPGVPEVCDGIDNNCDDLVDDTSAIDAISWYEDADGDGQGSPGKATIACEAPPGWVGNDTDCDDGERYSRKGAREVCDGIDNNCDGVVDYEGCVLPDDLPTLPGPHRKEDRSRACTTAGGSKTALLAVGLAFLTASRRRRPARLR